MRAPAVRLHQPASDRLPGVADRQPLSRVPAGRTGACVIHLRRGDNSVQGREREFARPLLNDYYVRVCGTVVAALRQLGVPFVVRLHTEIPPWPYTLHPGIPGVYFNLDRPSVIEPADYALEDFDVIPNLETVLNVEPRARLDDFADRGRLISVAVLPRVRGRPAQPARLRDLPRKRVTPPCPTGSWRPGMARWTRHTSRDALPT